MPIIPQYNLEVTPSTETPNVLANPQAMSGGQGYEAIGKGLSQVGDEVISAITTIQDKQRDLDLTAAQTDVGNQLLDKSTQISQLKGNLAHYKEGPDGEDLSLTDYERQNLPKLKEEILKGHKLDAIGQQEFDKWWNTTAAPSYMRHVAGHQATEQRQYAVDQIDAKTELAKKLVHQNPALLPSLIADLKDTIKKLYPGSNVDDIAATKIAQIEDQAKASQEGRNVNIAVQDIQRKFLKDPQYKGDKVAALHAAALSVALSPDDHPELKDLTAKESKEAIEALSSHASLAEKVYKADAGPAMLALIEKIDKGNMTQEQVFAEVNAAPLTYEHKEHLLGVYRQKLSDDRSKESSARAAEAAIRGARASERSAETAARAEENRRNEASYYHWASHPEVFASMDSVEFSKLRSQMGDKEFKHLQEDRKKANSPAALHDVTVHADTINDLLSKIPGIDDSQKGKYFGKLKTAIAREQTRVGRQLSNAEIQATVIEDMQVNLVKEQGFFGSTKEKRKIETLKTDTPVIPKEYLDQIQKVAAKRGKFLSVKEEYDIYQVMKKNEGTPSEANPDKPGMFSNGIGKEIKRKAIDHARQRIKQGKSPFASNEESPK